MSFSPSIPPSVLPASLSAQSNPILDYVERMQAAGGNQSCSESSEPAKPKARPADRIRLPRGIFLNKRKGRSPTYTATAGLDPATQKVRRKGGFKTVDEAIKWRERTFAADAPADQEAINFTANLPLAFGQAILQVKKRFSKHDANDAAQQPSGISRQAFLFTPAVLDEMAVFWLERHPKGAHGLTFGAAVDRWLENKEQAKLRPRSTNDIKDCIGFWRELSDRRCTEITHHELEAILKSKRTEVGGYRIRNLISKLSDLFRWLQSVGELPAGEAYNPVNALVRPTIDPTSPDPFTFAEATGLLSLALQTQNELNCLGYIAVCLFGGSRFTETSKLIWGTHVSRAEDIANYQLPDKAFVFNRGSDTDSDDEDDDEAFEREMLLRVTADIAKKRRQRLVSMPPNLCAILLEMGRRGWIENGSPVIPAERLVKCFRAYAAANGIFWRRNGLRSSFGSHYYARTGSLESTIAAMGHVGDAATFKNHYFQIVPRVDARKFFRLGFAGLDTIPQLEVKVPWVEFIEGYRARQNALTKRYRCARSSSLSGAVPAP